MELEYPEQEHGRTSSGEDLLQTVAYIPLFVSDGDHDGHEIGRAILTFAEPRQAESQYEQSDAVGEGYADEENIEKTDNRRHQSDSRLYGPCHEVVKFAQMESCLGSRQKRKGKRVPKPLD